MKTADPKAAAGRAFVRSLNILLKFARLYGYDHVRTAEQLQIAWEELREAIPDGTESGLLLGASGAQLFPGDPQPFGGSDVLVSVKPSELQENIQASHERPACRRFWVRRFHAAVALFFGFRQ